MKKVKSSEKLIDTVQNVPQPKESPIVTEDTKAVKPTTSEQDREKRHKDKLKKDSRLISPDLIVEWAMKDAQANQLPVDDAIEALIKKLDLTKEQAEDVKNYYEKIINRRKQLASLMNKIVDEVGNGFSTVAESFKYQTMDMNKKDRYELKRFARKAGFQI